MENEKRKYWFFGSKLNTALLLVLIVLMVIALRWMSQNKEVYMPVGTQEPVELKQEEKISWSNSPSEFGTVILYPSNWQITPQYYSSPAEQAEGREYLVGYGFMLPSGAMVFWGGAQGGCSDSEFGEFKYGSSSLTCLKGYRLSIGKASARESLSPDDLKLFGDFVVRNK